VARGLKLRHDHGSNDGRANLPSSASSPGHEWDGPSQAAANGSGRLSLFPDGRLRRGRICGAAAPARIWLILSHRLE
jgi:hypothetical protein